MSRGNQTVRPRQQQTKALIFKHAHVRVIREVDMPSHTAEMLDRYVAWAAEEVGADAQEAMTLTMDQALRRFFRRDKLFKTAGRSPTAPVQDQASLRMTIPPTVAISASATAGSRTGSSEGSSR